MNLLIYLMLMIMSILTIYTPNLFFMWMFLEISSMLFVIYLNINSLKIYSILYFLISSITSILIMFTILNSSNLTMNYLLTFSLWLKLGIYPLNYWMNFLMKNMNYISLMPLLTIMKFIPTLMFINFVKMNYIIMIFFIISMLPPIILSFNTSSYTMLLNYSSMYNMPLILLFSLFNLSLMMIYILNYMIISLYIMLILNFYSIYYKNSLNLNMSNNNKFFINLMMFMYAQLPPFSTFIMKWNLINFMMSTNNYFLMTLIFMILCSLMMTFNYLNFNNNSYYLNSLKINHKIYSKKKMKFLFNIPLLNFLMMTMYMYMN